MAAMNRTIALYAALVICLSIAAAASLCIGSVTLSLTDVFRELSGEEGHLGHLILYEIRLPRTLLALLVGATLGMAGGALQGFLRNPLAEPGLLGVGNGAALGAVIAIYSGITLTVPFSLPIYAMMGAMLAVVLVYVLSGQSSASQTLILAGIAVSSLFASCVAVALNLAPNPFAAMEVVFWLMGSLSNRTMEQVVLVAPFILCGWLIMLSCSQALDALSLGRNTASSLGISLRSVQWRLAAGVALSVGAGVAVTGSIGFIGLVVPHIMRPFVGSRPGALLPVSALGGAILLLLADIAVRLIPTAGMELRVGVITALVGAPFFLLLLFHHKRRMA